MEYLLHLALSNVVASLVLALVAAAAAFLIRRRPALIHGLWLLVLLKLFTPPLVRLPAPWPAETPSVPDPPALKLPADSAVVKEDAQPQMILLHLDAAPLPVVEEPAALE